MISSLGYATDLDVDRIHVTHHALVRYLERRGRKALPSMFGDADRKLRSLLARATTQRPAIFMCGGSPTRRYLASGFAFIVSADHGTLITVYPFRTGGGRTKGCGHRRFELADWDEEDG